MLYFLYNRIEKNFAVTADGFALSGWLTARKFCLGLLQKHCFILGWLALRFCYDIIF